MRDCEPQLGVTNGSQRVRLLVSGLCFDGTGTRIAAELQEQAFALVKALVLAKLMVVAANFHAHWHDHRRLGWRFGRVVRRGCHDCQAPSRHGLRTGQFGKNHRSDENEFLRTVHGLVLEHVMAKKIQLSSITRRCSGARVLYSLTA